METIAFNEYLEKRYYHQLKYYEDASGKNQLRYKIFQWVLIILSTITTILAALPQDKFDIQFIVVLSAASVTILTAGLKTFQYQELWVNYRSTIEQLRPEIYYYSFNVGDYGAAGVDKESTFVLRVEQILNKEHDGWPAAKKLLDQSNLKEQPNDSLQNKLDELLREKFNTQKKSQPEAAPDVNHPQDAIDADQAENVEQTIPGGANTGNHNADPIEENTNSDETKRQ